MTTEQAIDLLDNLIGMIEDNQENDYDGALKMAIEALRAQEELDFVQPKKSIPCTVKIQAQAEKACVIEKSNFSKEQYKLDTDTAYECGYNAGLQAQTDCNTCDKAVRDRLGVIGCAKFDSKPTVALPSAEPCDDAISREELLKAIDTWDRFGVDDTNSLFRLDNLSLPHYVSYIHYDDVIKCIKGMSSVNPQEPKTGHWVKTLKAVMGEGYMWYCDKCGHEVYQDSSRDYPSENFCPHCGADMRGEQDG